MYNKLLLSGTVDNQGGKGIIKFQEMQGLLERRETNLFLWQKAVEGSLPHRKALHSCPFGEPAWKGIQELLGNQELSAPWLCSMGSIR